MDNDLVVIRVYGNHPEAGLAKSVLEASGISAVISSDDCGGIAGGQTFIRGVRLLVAKRHETRARDVLGL
ncbi:MAG: DUF2007 domain-containing protein [Spirochaetes bacterium]|nr:DUF2007 domain-containing protein [Spirochaetota bacterium]